MLHRGLCASVRETVRHGLPLRVADLLDIGGHMLAHLASRLFLQDVDEDRRAPWLHCTPPSRCPSSPPTRQPQRRQATPHRKTPTTANLKPATSLLRARRSVPHRQKHKPDAVDFGEGDDAERQQPRRHFIQEPKHDVNRPPSAKAKGTLLRKWPLDGNAPIRIRYELARRRRDFSTLRLKRS